jgi:tetratricopeptide (TPR) repeat protein
MDPASDSSCVMRMFWTVALLLAFGIPSAPGALSPVTAPPQAALPRQDASALARLSRSWSDSVESAPSRDAATKAARQALDLAQEAVKADPKNAQAHLALAIAAGKWTDFVDAKTKLALSRQIRSEAERAIALDTQLDLAYHVLGRWHLEVASVNPLLRFGARFTVGSLPPASLEEAVRNLEKAAELSPKTILHHQHLALAYQAQGRRSDAAHQWRMVLDLPAAEPGDEAAKQQARAALGK